jgi:hypothetical protein
METITKFALNIDGKDFSVPNVSPFYQRDPFLGGHNYELIIETNNPKDFKNLLLDTNLENLFENK